MTVKQCSKCKLTKDATTEFYQSKGKPVSWCKECCAEYRRSTKAPSRSSEHRRAWLNKYKEENPNVFRDQNYRKKYGITYGEYERLLVAQDNCCAICKVDHPHGSTGSFHVDHDHTTGKVRAILCGNCNRALGLMADSPERMEAAAAYLRRHSEAADVVTSNCTTGEDHR